MKLIIAVCLLAVGALAHTRVERVLCDRITSCEACVVKQTVNSMPANPCYWDPKENSCVYNKNEDYICSGNQAMPTIECNRCKANFAKRKPPTSGAGAGAGAVAGAAGAPVAPGVPAAGGAPAAGAGGFKKKMCAFPDGTKGLCMPNSSHCNGRASLMNVPGCNGACCALNVNSAKAKARDKCRNFSGASNCWSCVRNGCVFHKTTAACISPRSAMGKAGDANLIQQDVFCSTIAKERQAMREKNIAKAKARQAKAKF